MENAILADDSPAGAPATDDMFEPLESEDGVDYTDGGEVT